jgi:hypothetical protein
MAHIDADDGLRPVAVKIKVNNIEYMDKFEWDICNPNNSPEYFSLKCCAELGLTYEHSMQLAFLIREQVVNYLIAGPGTGRGSTGLAMEPVTPHNVIRTVEYEINAHWEPAVRICFGISDEAVQEEGGQVGLFHSLTAYPKDKFSDNKSITSSSN